MNRIIDLYKRVFIDPIALFSIAIMLILTGCISDDQPIIVPKTVQRTVLVYMLSDNNLGESYRFDSRNINDMLQVAANGELNGGNLVIYRDGYEKNPQLILIKADGNGKSEQVVINEYPDRNSATPEVLGEIIEETVTRFPAEEYGLILWSHCTGWAPKNSSIALAPRRIGDPPTRSFGDDGGQHLELDELAQAIPDGQFHFILSDACFSGGVEFAYQLRNKTDYYIGSVAEVMGAGMPYSLTIPRMFYPEMDLTGVCHSIYTHYNALSGANRTSTVSLINCSRLETLADVVATILENHPDESVDINEIQHFDRQSPYICFDLEDYLSRLASAEEAQELKEALNKVILYQAATPYIISSSNKVDKHCGLSCYILDSGKDAVLDGYYQTLDWYNRVYPIGF